MFLDDLIQRTYGEAPVVAPRRASRFEPQGDGGEPAAEAGEERVAPRMAVRNAPPGERAETGSAERIEPRAPERPPPQREATPGLAAPEPPGAERRAAPAPEPLAPARRSVSHFPDQPPPEPLRRRPVSEPTRALDETSEAADAPARETVVRERVESRLETRTIERRLESLERQTRIERVERLQPAPPPPEAERPGTAAAPAGRERPPAAPARPGVVVPELRRAPPPAAPAEGPAPEAAAPVVHVTIGRVEVRATPPAPARPSVRGREPRVDLEDYLRRREKA